MENQKLVFCYGVDESILKVRKHRFDWKEGDQVITDGKKTEIYAVFDASIRNLDIMACMFEKLNTKASMYGMYGPNYEVYDVYDEDIEEDVEVEFNKEYNIDYFRCTPETVRKRPWKDYEKQLDLMEEVFTKIR